MCRTLEQVKTHGRPMLDPTAGMTDAEQAAYWKASRDRMAAQATEQAARLDTMRAMYGTASERAATADALAKALEDMLAGWRYIRQHHGDLYGVGWDRAEQAADAALSLARGA